jgi:hypothetical protein
MCKLKVAYQFFSFGTAYRVRYVNSKPKIFPYHGMYLSSQKRVLPHRKQRATSEACLGTFVERGVVIIISGKKTQRRISKKHSVYEKYLDLKNLQIFKNVKFVVI